MSMSPRGLDPQLLTEVPLGLDTLLSSVGKDWLPVTHRHASADRVITTAAAKEVEECWL